jgi:spore cortex formation protein SpoVR/YcgB (stage V sporulation)
MENFRDDSFILQYLSPKVIRDMKLFTIVDNEQDDEYEIGAIHNERGYKRIREQLSIQYDPSYHIPGIQITKVDLHQTSKLYLTHYIQKDRKLDPEDTNATLEHIRYLWGFPVELHSRNKLGINENTYEVK